MFLLLATVIQAASYSYEQPGRLLAATSGWTVESKPHYDANLQNTVSSCYRSAFTYYVNFSCDTLLKNCLNGISYCNTLTDPLDTYVNKTNFYLAVCLPTILGGLCLLGCLCTTCCCYYGGQAAYSYSQKKKVAKKSASL